MTIYLLRHGETQWNKAGRKQGRSDSPLTSTGRIQANQCADVLNLCIAHNAHISDTFEMIVSPLGRAQETAKIICAALDQPPALIRTAQELAEHDYGQWQGLTNAQIDQAFPGQRNRRSENHWKYQIPNGESYELLSLRVCTWLERQNLADAIIVAHEMVNRVILGNYLELGVEETLKLQHPHGTVYQLQNRSVTALRADVN